uniref:HP domain-containing protein n=1 Tax=Neogobius melanostomus TaxID=47308 RepID=A0A8C6WM52_9GOBI
RLLLKPSAQTSPGSVLSLRPTVPGSPVTITARVDGGVIGYKDLAALPRDKAILEIERPDLMLYQPHYCYSPVEVSTNALVLLQRSLSPFSVSPPPSPDVSTFIKSSCTRGHCSTEGFTVFMQHLLKETPPQGKHMEDLIIESSKFPAAQAPDPNRPSAIETESWPCPPSTAVIEQESRRKGPVTDEEEEETDDFFNLRVLQKQQLNKIQSNIGKILLKEEMHKSSAPMRRKKTRSLPERNTGLCSSDVFVFLQNGDSQTDRGTSPPERLQYKVFPYTALVVTQRGRSRLPPEVDRTQLERHLSEDEFFSVFRMTLRDFDQLSLWKRNELKKRVCLF